MVFFTIFFLYHKNPPKHSNFVNSSHLIVAICVWPIVVTVTVAMTSMAMTVTAIVTVTMTTVTMTVTTIVTVTVAATVTGQF